MGRNVAMVTMQATRKPPEEHKSSYVLFKTCVKLAKFGKRGQQERPPVTDHEANGNEACEWRC